MIGAAALGVAALQLVPALVSSARHFEQCFEGIEDTSRALSPVERLVFGLALANTSGSSDQVQGAQKAPRT